MRSHHFAAAALASLLATTPTLAAERAFKPVIGFAITGGGEKLVTVEYEDGTRRSITSGGLIQGFVGAEFRPVDAPFALQATIGYHSDKVSASNGSLSFQRVPFEVIGFWYAADRIRLGGGLRKAFDSRFETTGFGNAVSDDFNMRTTVGPVLQAEWFFSTGSSLFLRYVSEKYKSNFLAGGEVKGDHGGLGMAFRF